MPVSLNAQIYIYAEILMAATMPEFPQTSFALCKLNYANQWPIKGPSASHAMHTTDATRLDSSRLAGIITVHFTNAQQAIRVASSYLDNARPS
jgi:hypothetical protein